MGTGQKQKAEIADEGYNVNMHIIFYSMMLVGNISTLFC